MMMKLRIGTSCLFLALACAAPADKASEQNSASHPEGEASERHYGHPEGIGKAHHRGPKVAMSEDGPMRSAKLLYERFDVEQTMKNVTFIDQYYRAPGNEGYEAVIDHFQAMLREAGFGNVDGLELEILEQDMDGPAWTPRSASLNLVVDEKRTELHGFTTAGDADRVMLPINAPSCSVEGPMVFDIELITEGAILVTSVPARRVINRARQRGAVAVVSAFLEDFNLDPSGKDRHRNAIHFTSLQSGGDMPVAQISPRSYDLLKQAFVEHASARLSLDAKVELTERPLRTLVARVIGKGRDDEAIAMASHVQEPGACDNASGAAGLIEAASVVAELLQAGDLDWPARTVVFLWGDEFRQTRAWLESTTRRPIAGFSSDMTGESHGKTGAIALLERDPDPGALLPLAPDEHTPWGAGEVSEEELNPNALSVIARCAMQDVGEIAGGWISADHPWEGGSDHDEFIDLGIPAVLFWHFTDFAYHTSLDRIDMVDGDEIKRTEVALVATAMALANPQAKDLERYRASIKLEETLRVAIAEEAGRADIAQAWKDWCKGSAEWLEREMNF
ncbi:MAG: aminopeptidase YwaD [Planctomycetota bacterium]|jgi:aminopeptidase YwaD